MLVKQSATLDSSFWVNVQRSGLLASLLARYRLTYPPAVAAELSERFASGREFWRLVRAGELDEVSPTRENVRQFGPGERQALNVALEHRDWVLFIDDRRPFEEAIRLGLQAISSPALVVLLAREGAMSTEEALATLARLAALGRLSPRLIDAASAALQQLEEGGS
ncbi:MAG TPA: hypothetical protein VK009_18970 [Chloroflexota bacterium]|nr:hypothetical protein [Chloroflexota bacterium]